MRATVTLAEYEDLVLERSIRIRPGKITVTINDFNSSDKIKVGSTTAKKPVAYAGLTSGAEASWRLLRGEKDCVLANPADGSVIARAVSFADGTPECSIQLVARKEGHETFRSGPVSIPLEEGDLGTITPPVYGTGTGNSLPLKILMGEVDDGEGSTTEGRTGQEGHLDMSMTPREGNHLPIHISAIEVEGYESNGTTVKADVCTIDDDNTSETFGRVSVSDAAENGDKCKVLTKVVAVGYGEESIPEVVLTVVSGELEFGTELNPVPVFAFMGDLKVGASSHPSTKPSEDDSNIDDTYEGVSYLDLKDLPENYVTGMDNQDPPQPVEVAITWHFQARATDAGGAALEMGCIITPDQNDSDRRVLVAYAAKVGGHCLVKAIAQVAGYAEQEVVISIPFAAGDLLFAEESPNKTLYAGNLRVGSPVEPGHAGHHYDDSRVAVDWGSFRVEGYDGSASDRSNDDPADDTAKDGVCSVDGDGMVSIGDTAASGDICEVYGVASANNYNDTDEIMVGTLTVSDQLMFGTLTGPVYNQGLALRGLPIAVATAPMVDGGENGADADVTWTYAATGFASGTDRTDTGDGSEDEAKEDVCSIDENNGTLTPGSAIAQGDFCEVVATAHASGYESKAAPVVPVTVNDTFASLTWGTFPSSGTVGVPIALSSNLPSSTPVADSFSYSTNANCNMVSTKGSEELSFLDNEECVVTVTAIKQGYLGFPRSFRVTPAAGTIAASFATDYTGVVVNDETAAPDAGITFPAAGAGVTSTYALAQDSLGCTLNSDGSGAVTGTAVGSGACKVVLTLSKRGFSDLSNTYTIDVGQGTQTLTWADPYAASVTFPSTLSPSGPPANPISTGGALAYEVKTGSASNCEVHAGTGVITPLAAGAGHDCVILIKYAENTNFTASDVVEDTVAINKGTLGTITWGTFSSTLEVGGDAKKPSAPTGAGITNHSPTIGYGLKNNDATNCSLDTPADGTVSAKAVDLSSTKKCILIGTASKAGYNNKTSGDIAINLSAGTIVVAGADTATQRGGSYATVKVGAPTAAPVLGSITKPSGGTGITKTYTTTTGSACGVVSGSGAVTGKVATDTCTITLTLTADGYSDKSYTYPDITVAKGEQVLTWATPYSVSTMTVAATVSKASSPSNSVTNGGGDLDYSTNNSAYCTVDTSGTVTAKAAGVGRNCIVKAKYLHNDDYNESNAVTHTIRINAASWGTWGWDGYSDNSPQYGDTMTLRAPTINPPVDGVTWTYTTTSNSCTVVRTGDNAGALTLLRTGTCSIKIAPSKPGYKTVSRSRPVYISLGDQDTPSGWESDPYGTASPTVGVGADLALTGSKPDSKVETDGGTLTYSVTGSDCSVNPQTGTVTGGSVGTGCTVTAHYPAVTNKWSASSAATVDEVEVVAGSRSITWTPSDTTTYAFNATRPEFTAYTTGTGDSVTYEVVPGESNTAGCSWQSTSGTGIRTLTWTDDGSCQVRVLVENANYADARSTPVTITISPIAWTTTPSLRSYSPSRVDYGRGPLSSRTNDGSPAATWTFSTSSASTICEVGESSGTVTINGEGTCSISAVPDAPGRVSISAAYTSVIISKGTQSAPDASGWTGTLYGGPSVAVGETVALGGTGTPDNPKSDGGALVYSTSSDACTISNSATGAVQGDAEGQCVVKAHFAAVTKKWNVSGKTTVSTFPVGAGTQTQDNSWNQNDITENFGTTPSVAAFTASNSGTVSYEVVGGNGGGTAECTLTDRQLSFADDGTCEVQVRVRLTNYADWTSDPITVTVNPINITGINWGTYGSLKVGGNANAPSVTSTPTINAAGKTYTQDGLTTPGCTTNASGRLTGVAYSATTNCRVKLTLSKNGYNDESHTYELAVAKGDQPDVVRWANPYGSGITTVATGGSLSAPTNASPSNRESAGVKYQRKSGTSACTVASDGEITAGTTAGTCVIEVKYKGTTNYNESPNWVELITITVEVATDPDMSFNGVPTLAPTGELIVGDSSQTVEFAALPANPAPGVTETTVTWTFSVAGFESDGSTVRNNLCTVAGSTVSLGSGAGIVAGDICRVSVVGTATGYNDYTSVASVDLTVMLPQQGAITWTDPYFSNPSTTVGGLEVLYDNSTIPTGSGSAGVEFRVKSGSEAYCRVASYGIVFPISAGNCVVEARFAAVTNSYRAGDWQDIETIVVNSSGNVGLSRVPTLSYTGSISHIDNEVYAEFDISELPAVTDDGHNTAITWVFIGPRKFGPDGRTNDRNVCEKVNGEIAVKRQNSVDIGDICRVEIFANTADSVNTFRLIFDVPVKTHQAGVTANIAGVAYGTPGNISAGSFSSLSIVTAPTTGGGYGSLEYRVKPENASYCTVDSTTGTINTVTSGGDCIIQARWTGDETYAHSRWRNILSATIDS